MNRQTTITSATYDVSSNVSSNVSTKPPNTWVSSVFDYTTYLFGTASTAVQEWDTKEIDLALLSKIDDGDKILTQLYSSRKNIQSKVDKLTLEYDAIKARYESNKQLINSKISEIRNQLNLFVTSISNIVPPVETNTDEADKQNLATLQQVVKVLDFSKSLQSHLGKDNLFNHVSTVGEQVTVSYHQARAMNVKILDEAAKCGEEKQPLIKQIMMIDRNIRKINQKMDLIKSFKTEYSRIDTSDEGPLMTGEHISLLRRH